MNASTGERIWRYRTGFNVRSSPAVSDGVVYIGSRDHAIYALNASTGDLIWNYITEGEEVASSPAFSVGVVYVGSLDHILYALNASTGVLLWNYTTGDLIYSSPTFSGGVVYVGSWDHNLYALNASTGVLLWNYTTGNHIYSSPAVSGGVVYIGSHDHNVYAFTSAEYSVTVRANGLSSSLFTSHVYDGGVDQSTPYLWDGSNRTFTYSEGDVRIINVDEYVAGDSGIRYRCEANSWTTAPSGDQEHTFSYMIQYDLTVVTDPVGLEPSPVVMPLQSSYDEGTEVVLSAESVEQYTFEYWIVDGVNQEANETEITITIDASHAAIAHYTPEAGGIQYDLTVVTDPVGLEPSPVVMPLQSSYDEGTEVVLSAESVEQYTFEYWIVDGVNQEANETEITITIDASHAAIAHYTPEADGGLLDLNTLVPILVSLVAVVLVIIIILRRR